MDLLGWMDVAGYGWCVARQSEGWEAKSKNLAMSAVSLCSSGEGGGKRVKPV